MNHFIQKTFQLKDPNITIDMDRVEEQHYKGRLSLFYFGTLTYVPKACECCGIVNDAYQVVKNGTRHSRLTLASITGLPAYLNLAKQRFKCKTCGQSFTAKTSFVDPHCFISKRVTQMIMDRATRVMSEVDIAKDTHVSPNTVRRVIHQAAATLRIRPTSSLPEHLCFDEFKSVKSVKAAMSFIYCDAINHQVVDVVEDRKAGTLKNYFIRYDLAVRRQVKSVTIDMYEPYIQVIHRWFPNADIIMDPFHLIQALNRELSQYRVQFMNTIRTKDRRLYNKLKRYWKLIQKNPNDLKATTYHRFPLFDWLTNTQGIVDYLLAQDTQLKATYQIVHQLGDAYRTNNWPRFESTLIQAKQLQLPAGLRRVLRSFKKYQTYIHNTFSYPGLTNGPIEGINNKIKVLKRTAYGYRNYSHFRDRILLMTRLYVPQTNKKDQATTYAA